METTAASVEGGSLKTIPGPPGNFLVGSLFDAWKDPLALFTGAARTYGNLVQFRFAWMRYFLINEATAAHHALIENAKGYHKSPNYQGNDSLRTRSTLLGPRHLRPQRHPLGGVYYRQSTGG